MRDNLTIVLLAAILIVQVVTLIREPIGGPIDARIVDPLTVERISVPVRVCVDNWPRAVVDLPEGAFDPWLAC